MADMFCTCSRQEAKREGVLSRWEESHQANIRCAHDIDSLISSRTKDGTLEPDCAGEALERWGFLRVQYVLSNTLIKTGGLGFEPNSLRWARSIFVPYDKDNGAFKVQAEKSLLAQFVQQTYAEYQALGMFGAEHCQAGSLDYRGKVLILRPDVLKEEYWSAPNQLWLGEGGFGCSPTSSGRAVYATCLGDGEKTRWNRSDFLGVLDEQYLPNWAQEKLAELRGPDQKETDSPDQEQADSPAQGGMEMR